MADLLKFLFKSKFMRKLPNIVSFFSINLILYSLIVSSSKECSVGNNNSKEVCAHGVCRDNYCDCQPGWSGKYCQFCSGRVRLWNESGIITDGSGNYSEDNQCTWLIDPNRPNSHIRLYLDHFATECSWDHLYIYDGGSIYDPLLAVFSGMIVQDHYQASRTPEVVAKSGKALLYFYSDAAYNLTGFSISYKLNGCPSSGAGKECSGHGVCIEGACTCDAGWAGNDCTIPLCPFDCHGNGDCSMERHRCLCHPGYTGSDCNQKIDLGWWESYPSVVFVETSLDNQKHIDSYQELERASHSSIVIDEEVWIIGGYFFDTKSFILANNLTDKTLRTVEPDSQNYPKKLYGHSSVSYNGSIFIYGGATPNGIENNELWKFDPDIRTLKQIEFPTDDSENLTKSNFRQRRDSGKVSKNFLLGEGSDPPDKKRKDKLSENYRKSENGRPSVIREDSCLLSSSAIGSCMPIGVVGHAAVVVRDMMLIIFGHSSVYGTLNLVQEYHFRFNNWKVIEAEGAIVSGTYGHTAVWDPETSYVYVHGGLKTATSSQVVAHLLAYEPFKYKWTLKRPAPLPRFLHSATLMPGLMLVFGGNTHNDTAFSYGAKCFSADFLAYDIHCDTWHKLDSPPDLRTGTSRYGHTSVNVEGKMIVFGGFNGRMLGTTLYYHLGRCDIFNTKSKCLSNYPGQKCIWNRVLERCEDLNNHDQTAHDFCPAESDSDKSLNFTSLCNSQGSCHSCLYNSYKCVWCNNGCFYEKCNDYSKVIVSPEGCEDRRRWRCKSLRSCNLCHAYKSACNWLGKECVFSPNQTIVSGTAATSNNKLPTVVSDMESSIDASIHNDPMVNASGSPSAFGVTASIRSCPVTCSQRTTCANCTEGPCMWCFNQQRCVNNNSYLVSFPYGQCREWTTEPKRCPHLEKGLSKCMVHQTCKRCQEHIGCGWCDDGSGTGTGICLEGGQSGPIDPTNNTLELKKCPNPQWFFTSCPACNCNGHSHCRNDTVCIQPCANNTHGPHCGKCKTSFFGKPINGGLCKPCQCNNHGVTCEHETGVCHCHTKGVTGDHCERCDTQNNYYGEPLKGSCFYDLQIDYQFTFNLSKQEDIHIRQINFYNVPSKSDVDTDFDIQCSKPTRIKISARQTGSHETWIVKNFTGTSIKRRFSASEYVFGSSENNTTFHVYVFNFTPPIEIIISFSQHPKLDLIQFFSIFSLCFMVLLLMAFVMWKIKQKYDTYTRRQRLMVEMEAMASRPFRAIFLELQLDHSIDSPLVARVNNGTTTTPGETPVSPVQEESQNGEGKVPPVLQAISKKKGKVKGLKKSPKAEGPQSGCVDPTTLSNGVIQRNECNGSLVNIHPQISLQAPETRFVRNKNNPSPISLEPCTGNRAAVLSLLVELPTGNRRFTSPGHPGGLAVASALVSLGPPRKSSVEITATSTTTLYDPELGKKGVVCGTGVSGGGVKNKFVSR